MSARGASRAERRRALLRPERGLPFEVRIGTCDQPATPPPPPRAPLRPYQRHSATLALALFAGSLGGRQR